MCVERYLVVTGFCANLVELEGRGRDTVGEVAAGAVPAQQANTFVRYPGYWKCVTYL